MYGAAVTGGRRLSGQRASRCDDDETRAVEAKRHSSVAAGVVAVIRVTRQTEQKRQSRTRGYHWAA